MLGKSLDDLQAEIDRLDAENRRLERDLVDVRSRMEDAEDRAHDLANAHAMQADPIDVDQVIHDTIRELGLCPAEHDWPWRTTLTSWQMEISEARRRAGHAS